MDFLNRFRTKPTDPEIDRLQKLAQATPDHPDPHVDLARGYFNCLQSSGEWNKGMAQKGFDAFHKAFQLASRISSAEAHGILVALMQSATNLNHIYYAQQDNDQHAQQPLEQMIWVLDRALVEVKSDPDMVRDLRYRLGATWTLLGLAKLFGISSAPDLKGSLQQIDDCIDKAERCGELTPELKNSQVAMAEELLDLGEEQGGKTDDFPLYGEISTLFDIWNKKRPPIQDVEREEAAWKAIVLFENGLKWLARFPDSDEYAIRFDGDQEMLEILIERYFYLHTAHARVEEGVSILEKGIKSCPNGDSLHYLLGLCYCLQGDQIYNKFSKTAEWLPDTVVIAGGSVTDARAKAVYKKGATHINRAHELEPENYPRADEIIPAEYL